MSVSDIKTFFSTSTRGENDATNKIRERVLKVICNPPKGYLEDLEHGESWRTLYREWNNGLKEVADKTNVPSYTSTKIIVRGGRGYNYDADIEYYNDITLVANRKIEFKNGGSNIAEQPQFLSLQAKFPLFAKTYDVFWYENYLDKYLKCDTEITEPKPSLESYLKNVIKTKYNITPFFAQIKAREAFFQKEKNAIVNTSITQYLTEYGNTININAFSEKVKATQTEKIYLLWSNGKFSTDMMSEEEMTNITLHSTQPIKNCNVVQLVSKNTIYGLLLRWRNHKGILNPAWQISMKRL